MDSNSIYKLSYQLKMLNNEKNIKFSVELIQKGFIPHMVKIFTNEKLQNNVEAFEILTQLMVFFNELLKLAKLAKNTSPYFTENFITELIYYNPKEYPEYIAFMVKCFQMLKDLGNNKELIGLIKIRVGCVFEIKNIDKILEALLFSNSKDRIAEIVLEVGKSNELLLNQILTRLINYDILK